MNACAYTALPTVSDPQAPAEGFQPPGYMHWYHKYQQTHSQIHGTIGSPKVDEWIIKYHN